MKIIKKKERGYRSYSEKYDLSDAYAGKKGIPIGVLLLYILANRDDVKEVEITAEAEGDIGEEHNILYIEKKGNDNLFKDIGHFSELFRQKELEIWKIKGRYCGVEVAITGRSFGTVLCVRTPLTSKINLCSLFSTVETATFEYHDYDIKLIEHMKSKFKLNQKTAIQSIINLERYPNIFTEFLSGLTNTSFTFPEENAITVEGYKAEMLYKNYALSELGAYNYLIYLKSDPKQAIKDLRLGLPKK